MNIDRDRKIDYWVGIPVCFLLSVIHEIRKFLKLCRTPSNNPKKILFIELSEMGSAILAYSAMKAAREMFHGSSLYFLIFEENKHSIFLLDIVPKENVLTLRSSSIFKLAIDTIALFFRFRKERIDVSIDLELFSRFSNILSYMTGAYWRVGFYKFYWEGLYRGTFQTHRVAYNSHMHITLNFLALVYALKAPVNETPLLKKYVGREPPCEIPLIDFGRNAKDAFLRRLQDVNLNITTAKRIIIINPNAGEHLPIRAWPLKNYIGLIRMLLLNDSYYVIIMGVHSARKDAQTICQALNNQRCIDLTGKTSFREMIDLFNIADMLITNDSGPVHFASLTPIKIVAFYGPETPDLYGPLSKNARLLFSNFACSPCISAFNHRKIVCRDNKCLQVISVDYVYDLVKRFLNNETASITWPLKSSNVLMSKSLRNT